MTRLTHHSLNSSAGVLFEIQKRGLDHWYEALRQAELFIEQKSAALEELYFRQRKLERLELKKQRRLDALTAMVAPTLDDQDEIEALQDEKGMNKLRRERLQPSIEDALMELNTAQRERDRIVREHPEILEMTYDQKQAAYAQPALVARLARFIAGRTWGMQSGLGETVGATVFDLPPSIRQDVLDQEIALRLDLQLTEARNEAAAVLATLPSEQQEAVLMKAASLVLEGAAADGSEHLYG